MSQEEINQSQENERNRKEEIAKQERKNILFKGATLLVLLALLVWLIYSVWSLFSSVGAV